MKEWTISIERATGGTCGHPDLIRRHVPLNKKIRRRTLTGAAGAESWQAAVRNPYAEFLRSESPVRAAHSAQPSGKEWASELGSGPPPGSLKSTIIPRTYTAKGERQIRTK